MNIDNAAYDATAILEDVDNLPVEVLDMLMRDVVEYAGEDLEMSGIECLEECQSIMDVSPREMLFYVLFERDIEGAYEDDQFLKLIRKLIDHAGTPDNDLFND